MLMVIWRFCSSGSVSRMLVPSSTLPRRVVAPTAWRMDSTRLGLPDPPWPTTATFLLFVGSGDAAALESVVYEGYAPGGVSVMIEAATDNRNRTVSEIRAAFTRGGGKLGESGSVQWLFEQKGIIEIDAKGKDADMIELAAIDAGAEDVEAEPGLITVYTTPAAFERVKKALETAGIKVASAELSMRPTTTVRVEGDQAKKLLGLVETLEDLDDVIKVHANFDVPEEVLQHA